MKNGDSVLHHCARNGKREELATWLEVPLYTIDRFSRISLPPSLNQSISTTTPDKRATDAADEVYQ